jgi:hypothetical protein
MHSLAKSAECADMRANQAHNTAVNICEAAVTHKSACWLLDDPPVTLLQSLCWLSIIDNALGAALLHLQCCAARKAVEKLPLVAYVLTASLATLHYATCILTQTHTG